MNKGLDPDKYYRRMTTESNLAFMAHLISQEIGPGHWLLQRPYKDGPVGWDWTMAAEVVVLQGGKILVSGDLYPVIFAHYGPFEDPSIVVDWMGKNRDLGYYVSQKASIGLPEISTEYNTDVAIFELRKAYAERVVEIKEEVGEDMDPAEEIAVDNLLITLREAESSAYEGRDFCLQYLIDSLDDNYDDVVERFGDIGMVIAPRVFYAHAALARLSYLLSL